MISAAEGLKKLRQRASPPLTIRAMAEKLEMPRTSYERYEDAAAFKKPHLPMNFAERVARVLADHSIRVGDVMALAGVTDMFTGDPPLSADEEQMLNKWRQLSAKQRRLIDGTMEEMLAPRIEEDVLEPTIHRAAVVSIAKGPMVHTPRAAFRGPETA